MLVTKNQFFVFIACIAFGGFGGLLLSFVNVLSLLLKKKVVNFIFSIVALSIVGVLFSYYSYAMFFPNARVYMIIGVLIGIYLYYKSFYIILAKILKKFYNICKQKIINRKGKQNDRNKSKKNDSGNHGWRSSIIGDIVVNNDLSDDFNKSGRNTHRPLKRTNKTI